MSQNAAPRDEHSDVVIVGAGMAGLSAAVRAAELGLVPRLLEASAEQRNASNTRYGGAVFHLGFRSMRDNPAELARWLMTATDGFVREELAAAMADNASRGIDWLIGHGVEFGQIEPTEGWRDLIALPLGYHDRPGLRWEGLGSDRMLDRLEEALQRRGAQINRGVRAASLILDGGRLRGVRTTDGREMRAQAVILSDGGFESNDELLRRYVTPFPERMRQRGPGIGLGDGLMMAAHAGAELIGMEAFYGHMLSADARNNDNLWPFPFLDFLASSGVLVDRNAARFADEGKGGVPMANAVARHADADPFFALFDTAIWDEAGRHFFSPPNPNLPKYGGTLHRADTLDELAAKAGLPAQALKRTVEQHNAAVASGEFSSSVPPRTNAKNNARAISVPPFYAAPGCIGITHTMGGVRIDAQGRVLAKGGSPIPGLFAAGNIAGGLDGGERAYYAGGLAQALIFGLLAAEAVAAERNRT